MRVEELSKKNAMDQIEMEDLKNKNKQLANENKKLVNENKQLKDVAQMIDNMITFAQGNDALIQKKKELQKKKNKLRVEIQKQLVSLNELNNKVNPADGSFDLYVGGSTGALSPKSNRGRTQMPEDD